MGSTPNEMTALISLPVLRLLSLLFLLRTWMFNGEVILGLDVIMGLFPQSGEFVRQVGNTVVPLYHQPRLCFRLYASHHVPHHMPHNSLLWTGSLKPVCMCHEWLKGLLCFLFIDPAFLWALASRDTLSFHYQPTRASSAGSPTVTHCTPSSGTTGRKRRSFSTLSIASCCGYVMSLPDPTLQCLEGEARKSVQELVQSCFPCSITEKSIQGN